MEKETIPFEKSKNTFKYNIDWDTITDVYFLFEISKVTQRLIKFFSSILLRFDESINYVELDYPRDMSMFAGVGNDIDAVFQWKNGKNLQHSLD